MLVLVIVGIAFDGLDPARRSSYAFKIEVVGVDQTVEVYIAVVASDDFGLGLQLAQNGFDVVKFLCADLRCLVEQNHVAELYLLNNQTCKVVLGHLLLVEIVAARKFVAQAQGVHYGHHGVEFGNAIGGQVGVHAGVGTDGLSDGGRFADAAGLDYDVVEALLCHNVAELLHEVHFECAADATVLQGYKAVVAFAHNAALCYEACVDVYLANVVDNDGKFDAFLVRKYAVEQGGFATAQIACEQQYGGDIWCHDMFVFTR